jgi:BirA family biotin operon repressor/biotin-[acetyl-CoA-carboxylase] ligase
MKIGTIVHRMNTCSSTNDVAKRLAAQGAAEGTVVIAGKQTKGRGTKGRAWFSPKDKGLYFSVVLRPQEITLSLLPLVAGIAACEALAKACGLEARLLWPNDVVLEKKKLGGILCESDILGSRAEYVIVGMGLNIGHEEKDFPNEIRSSATSVRLAAGKPCCGDDLLQHLYKALNRWYSLYCRGKKQEIIKAFKANSALRKGEKIFLLKEEETLSGIFQGIGPDGALVLEIHGKKRIFYSAEIRRLEYN